MIIDVNAHLGHYAFRHVRHTSAEALARLMDRYGIDQALVSSLPAALYRDPLAGDQAMVEDIHAAGVSDRLLPLATINPRYADWQGDLERAVRRLGVRGIRLLPAYHDYDLGDAHGQAVLAAIAERGLFVAIPQRLEDRRQQHAWDRAEDLRFEAAVGALARHPSLRVIFQNWGGVEGALLARTGLAERSLVDLSRLAVLLFKQVDALVASAGAQVLAFGSHMPLNQPMAAMLKLTALDPALAAKAAGPRAAELLGLPTPALADAR